MTNLKAELPGYGTVWFDPQAMRNVLSFVTEVRQPIQVQSHLEMPGILVQLGRIQRT